MFTRNRHGPTTDAAAAYRERTGLNIAKAESTAQDGTIASFSRNNTLIVSSTTFYPVLPAYDAVYVSVFEDHVAPELLESQSRG